MCPLLGEMVPHIFLPLIYSACSRGALAYKKWYNILWVIPSNMGKFELESLYWNIYDAGAIQHRNSITISCTSFSLVALTKQRVTRTLRTKCPLWGLDIPCTEGDEVLTIITRLATRRATRLAYASGTMYPKKYTETNYSQKYYTLNTSKSVAKCGSCKRYS